MEKLPEDWFEQWEEQLPEDLKDNPFDKLIQAPKKAFDMTPPKRVTCMSAAELATASFPEVQFIVPELIPTGLTLLASSPKIGKSWMVLHIGDAVSTGGKVFGEYQCEQGAVLYLALEDNLRRMKDRLSKSRMTPSGQYKIETERLRGQEGIDYINKWLDQNPAARLIIIDTFGRFREESKKVKGAYESDTDSIAPLQNIASARNIGILLVHHTNKGTKEDFTQSVSGTQGLTGVADTIMKLDRKRNEKEGTLDITGRDIKEQQLGMYFEEDSGRWSLSEHTPAQINASDEQKRVIELFSTIADNSDRDSYAIVPAIVATFLGKEKQPTFDLLKRMKQRGIIEQVAGKGSGYRLRSSEFKWEK